MLYGPEQLRPLPRAIHPAFAVFLGEKFGYSYSKPPINGWAWRAWLVGCALLLSLLFYLHNYAATTNAGPPQVYYNIC
jgi:hypothetical protein